MSNETIIKAAPPDALLPARRSPGDAGRLTASAARCAAARSACAYLAALLASLVALAVTTQLWRLDLSIPFCNEQDSFLYHVWVRSIVDHGWYLTNPRLAAPAGLRMHDFPMADNLHFGALKLLSLIDDRWPVIVNVYYLLTFPLATLTALFSLRQLGIRGLSALAVSLLYAFLPYHWMRNEWHLFLAAYYLVPPAILVALWISMGQLGEPVGKETPSLARQRRRRFWLSVLVCLLQAGAGVYYAFFACFLFVTAGIAASCRTRRGSAWRLAILFSMITGLGVAANTLPSMIYWWREGVNRQVARRSVSESEVYGLKLVPLLLPVGFHNCPPLAKLRARYDRSSINPNASAAAPLGAVGSAGFLGLLGWQLFAPMRRRRTALVDALAMMNMATFLLGTVGGFGMLFSLLISPQFRAYNRVSVFIAFFSLAAVALWLERWERRWPGPRWRLTFGALLGAAVFAALCDQSPQAARPSVELEAVRRRQFEIDAAFANRMEALLPAGAAVYQLPYTSFPESPPVEKMADYEHFRPYLHSKSLRFSYGSVRGRDLDRWHQTIQDLPTDELVKTLRQTGFSGIYIDRRGYADRAQSLEAKLAECLGEQPLVSAGGDQSFFVLSRSTSHGPGGTSPAAGRLPCR